jgi:hypothetical protein
MRHLTLMLLLLVTTLSRKPMVVPHDAREPCPVVSTRVLREAPATCLQAGVQARMEYLQRSLQRLRQQMERLVPQS